MVSVFASSKQDVYFHLVVLGQKLSCLPDFHFNIVNAGLGSQSDLLHLNGMLFGPILQLLLFLVLGLTEVHDTADRRSNTWAYLNKIESGVQRQFSCLVSFHFAEHFTVLIDDADWRDPNSIIHPWQIGLHGLSKLRSSDCGFLPKKPDDHVSWFVEWPSQTTQRAFILKSEPTDYRY